MATKPNYDAIIETAFAAFNGPLVRRLTAITRDPAAAEDLAQEAFVRLVVEVRAGRAPDDIGAWLHRVAYNLAMSRGRRMSVAGRHLAALESDDVVPSPESLAVASEEHGQLREAMAGLGTADQDALLLSARGYRGVEIARLIGRTDAATRTMLCRARAKVRFRMIDSGFA
jgi:RNA polymerase sigma factor (sigma-70 family)